MKVENVIWEVLLKQGLLAFLLVSLAVYFKKFIERLFTLVENNTAINTKMTEALYQMKEEIKKCPK